jgi:uncharacterized membrane protein YdjX (TVP38/TMEM64 family)
MNSDNTYCCWQAALKVLAILILLACFVGGFVFLVKLGYMEIILKWIGSLGIWGHAMLVAFFIPVCYPWALGYGVVALCCGFLYGYLWGWITVIVGTNLGNFIVFCTVRGCFRASVQNYVQSTTKLKVLLVALERHTIKFGILLRYTPLPIGIQNAIFAVSHISLWHYLWISFVNTLPETFMWTYAGRNARNLADVVKGHLELGTWTYIIFAIDFAVLIVIVTVVVIVGRKALKKAEEEVRLTDAINNYASEEKSQPYDPQKSLVYWDIVSNDGSMTFKRDDSKATMGSVNGEDQIYIDAQRLLTVTRYPPLNSDPVQDVDEKTPINHNQTNEVL